MARSKTIQIFLKDAEPNGIKIAELSVSTAKVYVLPRKQMDFVKGRTDLRGPSLYMLFDDERTSVYIGECENFVDRIKNHETNKTFWEWAVVAVSSNSSLDKADVKFLESYSISKAIEIGRFEVQNRTNPNTNNLHEFKEEAILDFFDDIELLISTLGFNLFEPLKDEAKPQELENPPVPAKEKDIREYDTIVGPCKEDGRIEAFVKKNAWWAVRIAQSNIKKLKYVALYEAAPVSSIRYYAKITKIEPFEDKPGKYIIHHDGDIHELEDHVVLGEHPELALYGPRYYKLEDIKSSKTMAELTNKAFGSNY
jgi:hypothetical protein